jgi:hypothetical protein
MPGFFASKKQSSDKNQIGQQKSRSLHPAQGQLKGHFNFRHSGKCGAGC